MGHRGHLTVWCAHEEGSLLHFTHRLEKHIGVTYGLARYKSSSNTPIHNGAVVLSVWSSVSRENEGQSFLIQKPGFFDHAIHSSFSTEFSAQTAICEPHSPAADKYLLQVRSLSHGLCSATNLHLTGYIRSVVHRARFSSHQWCLWLCHIP